MPQIYVFPEAGEWAIKTERRVVGHYTDHVHAIGAAIDHAEETGRTGRRARVLMAEDGVFRPIGTYGKDLYPNSVGSPRNNRVKGTYRLP